MRALPFPSSCQRLSLLLVICLFSLLRSVSQDSVLIIDELEIPLPGVEVYTADLGFTSISDENGVVILKDVAADEIVEFRLLGYENKKYTKEELAGLSYILQLYPLESMIEEVLVVGRTDRSQESLPYQIQSISAKELISINSQTTADALSAHGDVFVQKSQMGGGSPVIRGFEANKVLLVVDGVRLNNAIYRNGHLQNAITVDQAMLEKIDLIYGPNSLIYGSDALGGVVHFRSKDPRLRYTDGNLLTDANYYLRYSSANNEKTGHLDFNIAGKSFASLSSISFSDFGDLRTGNSRNTRYPDFGKRSQYVEILNSEDRLISNPNPNVQIGTAYHQLDFLQKFILQINNNWQLISNIQYSTSSDIPRYDALIETSDDGLEYAEWYYGPQQRLLASLTAKHFAENSLYDKAVFITAWQEIDEDRINRRFGRKNRTHNLESVSVFSFTADLEKSFLQKKHSFYYGIDVQTNSINSTAFEEDIVTLQKNENVLTRYPSGGSNMTLAGIYAQYELAGKNKMQFFSAGFRYSVNDISFSYQNADPIKWPSRFYQGINSNNHAASWSLGYTSNYENGWQWRSLLSTAFRSPNIDDIAKIRVKSDEISFPNDQLTPEKSINAELTIAKDFFREDLKLGKFSVTAFYTQLKDAIIREHFQDINGSPIFVSNGDSLQITANVNAQKVYIAGLSANFKVEPIPYIHIDASASWVKGRIINESTVNSPLSHIPPFYGKIGIAYESDKWMFKIIDRFNAHKPQSEYGDSSDNLELATPEGALGWNTLNVYSRININDKLQISIAFENIFDIHYRPFASGVSAPGFNTILSLHGKLY